MTRINCIEPSRLTDRHLLAEYREMLRLRHAKPRQTNVSSYRPGKGHVLFFYDKGGYLLQRHEQLRNEMQRRGMNPQFELDLSAWPQWAMGEWTPSIDAQLANVARIINRLMNGQEK